MRVSKRTAWAILAAFAVSAGILVVCLGMMQGSVISSEARLVSVINTYKTDGRLVLSDYMKSIRLFVSFASFDYSPDRTSFQKMLEEHRKFDRENPDKQGGGLHLEVKDVVLRVASVFTQDTLFEGKVSFNSDPKPDHINIYLIRSGHGLHPEYGRNNCQYMGTLNIIFCDSNFIEEELKKISNQRKFYDLVIFDQDTLEKMPLSDEFIRTVQESLQSNMIIWIVGHEIGHAILHKRLVEGGEKFHFNLNYSPAEQAADAFVASKIIGDQAIKGAFLTLIREFIQQEFRNEARRFPNVFSEEQIQAENFPSINRIAVGYSRYVVPMLVRSIRVEAELSDGDFYTTIRNNVEIEDRTWIGREYVVTVVMVTMVLSVVLVFYLPVARNQGRSK